MSVLVICWLRAFTILSRSRIVSDKVGVYRGVGSVCRREAIGFKVVGFESMSMMIEGGGKEEKLIGFLQ